MPARFQLPGAIPVSKRRCRHTKVRSRDSDREEIAEASWMRFRFHSNLIKPCQTSQVTACAARYEYPKISSQRKDAKKRLGRRARQSSMQPNRDQTAGHKVAQPSVATSSGTLGANPTRELAAIMFSDIAGYTAIMGRDERKGVKARASPGRIA